MPAKKTTISSSKSKTTAKKAPAKKTTTSSKSTSAKTTAKKAPAKSKTAAAKPKIVLAPVDSPVKFSCFWRILKVKNAKTKKVEQKQVWIMIEDGTSTYEKYDSQQAAIKAFRKMKQNAIMKVQSVDSDDFVYTTATLTLLKNIGHDPDKIKAEFTGVKKTSLVENYQDEYSQFDVVETDVYNEFDVKPYDELFAEKEGDNLIDHSSNADQADLTPSKEEIKSEEPVATEVQPTVEEVSEPTIEEELKTQDSQIEQEPAMEPVVESVQTPEIEEVTEEKSFVANQNITQETHKENLEFELDKTDDQSNYQPTEESQQMNAFTNDQENVIKSDQRSESLEDAEIFESNQPSKSSKNAIYWTVISFIILALIALVVLLIVFNVPGLIK